MVREYQIFRSNENITANNRAPYDLVLSAEDFCDKSTWETFWVKIWRGEPIDLRGREALDYIRTQTAPLRDEFQLAIDWTRDDSYVSVNEMKYWIPVAWNNYGGRATLAGDAAHPMLICKSCPAHDETPL